MKGTADMKPRKTKMVRLGLIRLANMVEADISAMEEQDRENFDADLMERAIEWIRATIMHPDDDKPRAKRVKKSAKR